jgi:hypothetical protein
MTPYSIHLREPLIEGEHFRRLSVCEGGGHYRSELLKDVVFVHPHFVLPLAHLVSFRDGGGREWMAMTCRGQTIRKGYWWNGNSPKRGIKLFGKDRWFGTPDFAGTIAASLKHDADFQFHHCPHYPFSLAQANDHYRQICDSANFRLTHTFHGALADFSRKLWDAPDTSGCHSILL